jgi:hypothetical protein
MAIVLDGTSGVTFPAGGLGNTAGAAVGTTDTQTLTNKTIQGGAITLATAVASTSGTSIDFTSIPSWVKRITVMFSGVSTNGSSAVQVQLGDAGGIETTGYVGTGTSNSTGASPVTSNFTAGFGTMASANAAQTNQGLMTIVSFGSNIWVATFVGGRSNAVDLRGAGTKTLSGTLDRVRITTVNGTDTFDAGSINILYEG